MPDFQFSLALPVNLTDAVFELKNEPQPIILKTFFGVLD